jgi:hypothetical protein
MIIAVYNLLNKLSKVNVITGWMDDPCNDELFLKSMNNKST